MTYLYKCNKCVKEFTVNKPMSESSNDEYCPTCQGLAVRIFSVGAIKTGDGVK